MSELPTTPDSKALPLRRPTRAEAEDAVRTLLAWSGDDPSRPGLQKTPERVAEAFLDYFSGYGADAALELATAFEDPHGYNDMVLLKGITFESHCEHHIAPFFGTADVAYLPKSRIAGLSKVTRIVEIFARRLQTQEALTSEIALALRDGLDARGVAVKMSARHQCMAGRGQRQSQVATVTFRFLGEFETDASLRDRFVGQTQKPDPSQLPE